MAAKTEQVALVTGASSGIGEAAAHELLGVGFTVYGTSRKAAAGENRNGIVFLPLDVTNDESVAAVVREVLERSSSPAPALLRRPAWWLPTPATGTTTKWTRSQAAASGS
jgi:NAD(P)-dependent dehydrogenase (short-subunit alcohol dehydrogenase family)